MNSARSSKIEFIQTFRGIAALLVVLYHASSSISPYGTGLGDFMFGPAGSMGVTLFFIISGFIMAHTTVSTPANSRAALDFLIRRISRVWPPLAVACLAFVALKVWPFDGINRRIIGLVVHTLTFIPSGGAGAPQFGESLPSVGWTLNYESYFYLFFAISMLFGRARWLALFAWGAISLIALPVLQVGWWTIHTVTPYGFGPPYVQMMTFPLIWEFLAGVALGLIYNSRLSIKMPFGLLMFLSVASVAWQYTARFKIGYGITEWGTTLIPLVAIFAMANKQTEITHHPALTYLGNISYSLYLWHPLVHDVSGYPLTWMGYGDRCSGFSFMLYTTAISIAIAALSYHLLEKGLSEFIKNKSLQMARGKFALDAENGIRARVSDGFAFLSAHLASDDLNEKYWDRDAYKNGYLSYSQHIDKNPYPPGSEDRKIWWIARAQSKADWARTW
ncbi:acyltransferase [Burkholderia vietnamiensis]